MLNNEYKFRDSFKEFNSLDKLKKLDINKDMKVDLNEIKKLDIDNDGVISDSEFDKNGITSKIIQDEVTSKLPNLNESSINPNQIVFKTKNIDKKIDDLKPKNDKDLLYPSSITLESKKEPNHRLSSEIHNKYLTVKSLLPDNLFKKLDTLINKNNMNEKKINIVLNDILEKKDLFTFEDCYKVISNVKKKISWVEDQTRNLEEKSSYITKLIGTKVTRGISNSLNFLEDPINRKFNSQDFSDSNQVNNIASINFLSPFGNCGELAALSAIEARKIKYGKIEFFSVQYSSNEQNNHIFLVVNRDNLASLNPKDWGSKTLIIDPWREEVYKASDYDKYSEKNLIPQYQGTYTFDK